MLNQDDLGDGALLRSAVAVRLAEVLLDDASEAGDFLLLNSVVRHADDYCGNDEGDGIHVDARDAKRADKCHSRFLVHELNC